MTTKSMIDIAYNILLENKCTMEFKELWSKVSEEFNYSDSLAQKKLVQFYNDLMLDKRFASLENNVWDLSKRRKFEEIHVDTSKIILEDDEDESMDEEFSDEDESKEE